MAENDDKHGDAEGQHQVGHGLAQHHFVGLNGADQDLLHGAGLLFPGNGHGGQQRADHDQQQGHDAGHHKVGRLHVRVVEDPCFDPHRLTRAPGFQGPFQQQGLQVVLGQGGGIGVGAVRDHGHNGLPGPGHGPDQVPGYDDRGPNGPLLKQAGGLPGVGVPGLYVKIGRGVHGFYQGTALRGPAQVADAQPNVLDVHVDGVPEDKHHHQGHQKQDHQGTAVPEDMDKLLAHQRYKTGMGHRSTR